VIISRPRFTPIRGLDRKSPAPGVGKSAGGVPISVILLHATDRRKGPRGSGAAAPAVAGVMYLLRHQKAPGSKLEQSALATIALVSAEQRPVIVEPRSVSQGPSSNAQRRITKDSVGIAPLQ
jgi:hypothetical protein